MIVDSTASPVSRAQTLSPPTEKAAPQEVRAIEKPEGSLASRLDVQRDKDRGRRKLKGHCGKPDARPITYNARGAVREGPPSERGPRATGEPVDLFV